MPQTGFVHGLYLVYAVVVIVVNIVIWLALCGAALFYGYKAIKEIWSKKPEYIPAGK